MKDTETRAKYIVPYRKETIDSPYGDLEIISFGIKYNQNYFPRGWEFHFPERSYAFPTSSMGQKISNYSHLRELVLHGSARTLIKEFNAVDRKRVISFTEYQKAEQAIVQRKIIRDTSEIIFEDLKGLGKYNDKDLAYTTTLLALEIRLGRTIPFDIETDLTKSFHGLARVTKDKLNYSPKTVAGMINTLFANTYRNNENLTRAMVRSYKVLIACQEQQISEELLTNAITILKPKNPTKPGKVISIEEMTSNLWDILLPE